MNDIDSFLRRSMAEPVPHLSTDFERRIAGQVAHRTKELGRYRRFMFAGYGVTSAIASVVIMGSEGLDWRISGGAILVALAVALVSVGRKGSLRSQATK